MKSLGIYSIFRKDTKKALLYQDILRISIDREKEQNLKYSDPITHRDLAKRLMKTNQEFINRYKDMSTRTITISNRIENTTRATKGKLGDLIELGLMKKGVPVKELKGTGMIDTFTYTPAGYLFAWLLKRSNLEQRQNANNEIYNLLANAFKTREDSSSLAISMFLQKCKDKQVFGKLVEYIDSLIHSDLDPKIKSITDLLVYIFDSGFRDTQEQTIFMNLWYETIKELRPKIRKMMLYRMKSSVEKRFEKKLEYVSKEYEAFQFKLKNNYQQIALEGYCRNCKLKRNVALHYLDYISTVSASSSDIRVKCTICNMKDGIIISNLF